MFDIYKEQFESTTVWDDATILFYIALCLITIVLGSLSQKSYGISGRKNQSIQLLFVLFALLFFTSALRGALVGADTEEYRSIFENARNYSKSPGYNPTLEKGFVFLNQILSLLIDDGRFGIILLTLIFIILVYKSIKDHIKLINIFIAATSFICLYYFQSLNLVRIYLAASITMSALPLLEEKKYLKYLIVILITSTIHTSSLFMLLPTIALYFYEKTKVITITVLLASSVVVLYFGVALSDYINVARYMDYVDENESGKVGFLAIFEYLPVLYLLFTVYTKKLRGGIFDIFVIFSIISLVVRLLSYNIIVLGRLPIHFMSLFVIIIPIVINQIYQKNKKQGRLLLSFYTVYLLIRLHIYFATMLEPDGLMPYYTIFSE